MYALKGLIWVWVFIEGLSWLWSTTIGSDVFIEGVELALVHYYWVGCIH